MVGDPTRVMEVYPRRHRRETEMTNPRVEAEGKIRAAGRVTVERGATRPILREEQRNKGQRQTLHKSGTEGSLYQHLKCVGITREGPISQGEIQKIMGERRREEGPKSPRDISRRNLGLHCGMRWAKAQVGFKASLWAKAHKIIRGKQQGPLRRFVWQIRRQSTRGCWGRKQGER